MRTESKKISLSWKMSSSQGVVSPHKMRNWNDCTTDSLCNNCDKVVNLYEARLTGRSIIVTIFQTSFKL